MKNALQEAKETFLIKVRYRSDGVHSVKEKTNVLPLESLLHGMI
jgi:hypothetical protein